MMSSFRASASRPSEASLVVEVDESDCELLWFAEVVDGPVGCKLWLYDAPEVLPVLFDVDDGA